jgi:hypothetical protein
MSRSSALKVNAVMMPCISFRIRLQELEIWICMARLVAEGDLVDQIWPVMPDTLAIHYRRRGLWCAFTG